MKKIILLLLSGTICVAATTQNKPKSLSIAIDKRKQLVVFTNDESVEYEGYSGDSLIIEPVIKQVAAPVFAAGMHQIPLGGDSGTDSLGYKVTINTNAQFIIHLTGNSRQLHIKVPQQLYLLSVEARSLVPDAELSIRNLNCQFDVSAD